MIADHFRNKIIDNFENGRVAVFVKNIGEMLYFLPCNENGYPIPNTYFTKNMSEVRKISKVVTYPCIIKPYIRDKNWNFHFCSKVLIESTPNSLISKYEETYKLHKDLIIQEVIPGSDDNLYFSLCYFNKHGSNQGIFIGRKIHQLPIHFGTSTMTQSLWDPWIAQFTLKFFKNLNYKGYGNIEFKKDLRDNKYKIIEVTCRPWYPHGLSEACGLNLIYNWYKDLTDGNNNSNSSLFR